MAKAITEKRSHEFKPGWADAAGLESAELDRQFGVDQGFTRSPEQRKNMALAQRARWRKVKEARAAAAEKAANQRAKGRKRRRDGGQL